MSTQQHIHLLSTEEPQPSAVSPASFQWKRSKSDMLGLDDPEFLSWLQNSMANNPFAAPKPEQG